MSKIGIITFHSADSFGALMQCYALQKTVANYGHEVEIINYCPKYISKPYRIMFDWNDLKAGWNSGLKCLWRSVIYIRFKNLGKSIVKKNKMKNFRNKYFTLTKKITKYDQLRKLKPEEVYIAGSDQIWNSELTDMKLDKAYFLDFAPKYSRKIAYAASTGKVPGEEDRMEMQELLKNFDFISIREKTSLEVVQSITDKTVEVVLDPTLLLNKEEWDKLVLPSKRNEKYILFISLYYTKEQFDLVNKLSEEFNCKVIHYFYGRLSKRLQRNGGTCWFDSPQEIITLIKNAYAVVTDSYHITVFSIIYHKLFFTFPCKWSSRMEMLLNTIGLQDRFMIKENLESVQTPSSNKFDYKEVEWKIDKIRRSSFEYLNKSLKK